MMQRFTRDDYRGLFVQTVADMTMAHIQQGNLAADATDEVTALFKLAGLIVDIVNPKGLGVVLPEQIVEGKRRDEDKIEPVSDWFLGRKAVVTSVHPFEAKDGRKYLNVKPAGGRYGEIRRIYLDQEGVAWCWAL